ncbi:MAG TPA: hypothetical protein QF873_03120, partial [Patescibacteria group bacterium]|nr:hypothetical protein [Patescibacteria group bacterium]
MNTFKTILSWIGGAIAWLYRHSLGLYMGRLRESSDFRRGSAGTIAVLAAILMLGIGMSKTVHWVGDLFAEVDFSSPIDPAEPEYVEKVRLARDRLAGFDKDILPYVLDEYNAYVKNPKWHEHAQRCLKFTDEFQRAEKLTLYPWIMTAGMALHESRCDEKVRSYDNGRGLMQITKYDPRHTKTTRGLLGVRKVDFVGEPFHN